MSAAHCAQLLDRLRAFLRTMPAGIVADDAEAIAAGIDRYFAQQCSLDEAMGVHLDQGENHPGTIFGEAARNAQLVAAVALLGGPTRKNSEETSKRLADYEAGPWRRERTLATCPPHRVGRIDGHFWAALKAWPRVIGGKQIQNIVAAQLEVKSAFDFQATDGRSNPRKS
jgi:hypothetical protein